MPYDGSGGFTAYTPGNPVVTGTTISSTVQNNTINDIVANGLSFALTKDGQQVPTANIPMGAFKLTGLGAGTAATDGARVGQVQGSAAIGLNNVAGTNTITATLTPTLTAYANQQMFILKPAATNTGATTISIDSIAGGAKNIFAYGAACIGGELVIAIPALIEYDGTQFNIINPQPILATKASTFTFDGSGGTSGSITMTMERKGRFVSLNVPAVTATTGTGSTVIGANTAIDAKFWPATAQYMRCSITNNGAISGPSGMMNVGANGLVNFYRDGVITTAFTNTATAGNSLPINITYLVP